MFLPPSERHNKGEKADSESPAMEFDDSKFERHELRGALLLAAEYTCGEKHYDILLPEHVPNDLKRRVLDGFADSSPAERKTLCAQLTNENPDFVLPVLTCILYADPEEEVRAAAAHSLALLDDQRATEQLVAALRHEDKSPQSSLNLLDRALLDALEKTGAHTEETFFLLKDTLLAADKRSKADLTSARARPLSYGEAVLHAAITLAPEKTLAALAHSFDQEFPSASKAEWRLYALNHLIEKDTPAKLIDTAVFTAVEMLSRYTSKGVLVEAAKIIEDFASAKHAPELAKVIESTQSPGISGFCAFIIVKICEHAEAKRSLPYLQKTQKSLDEFTSLRSIGIREVQMTQLCLESTIRRLSKK